MSYSITIDTNKKVDSKLSSEPYSKRDEKKRDTLKQEELIEEKFDEKEKIIQFTSGNPDVEELVGELHLFKHTLQFKKLPERIDQLPVRFSFFLNIFRKKEVV